MKILFPFRYIFLVKIGNDMMLSFALYPFPCTQLKILLLNSNGKNYFLEKSLSGCERCQMQYGHIQQQYVSADIFALQVRKMNGQRARGVEVEEVDGAHAELMVPGGFHSCF